MNVIGKSYLCSVYPFCTEGCGECRVQRVQCRVLVGQEYCRLECGRFARYLLYEGVVDHILS